MSQSDPNRSKFISTLLTVVIGQVGCLTLVVILVSVLGGLWLDGLFGTKPMFTLVLLIAGIPLSVVLMLYASRRALERLKNQYETEEKKNTA